MDIGFDKYYSDIYIEFNNKIIEFNNKFSLSDDDFNFLNNFISKLYEDIINQQINKNILKYYF